MACQRAIVDGGRLRNRPNQRRGENSGRRVAFEAQIRVGAGGGVLRRLLEAEGVLLDAFAPDLGKLGPERLIAPVDYVPIEGLARPGASSRAHLPPERSE